MRFEGTITEINYLNVHAKINGKAVRLQMWRCSYRYQYAAKALPRRAYFDIPESYAKELGLAK